VGLRPFSFAVSMIVHCAGECFCTGVGPGKQPVTYLPIANRSQARSGGFIVDGQREPRLPNKLRLPDGLRP